MSGPRRRPAGPGKLLAGLVVGTLALVALGLYWTSPPPRPELPRLQHSKLPEAKSRPAPPRDAPAYHDDPTREAPPPDQPSHGLTLLRQPAPGLEGAPRIAIIIDDLGRSPAATAALMAINENFSFAVMPFESHTREVVAALRERDLEILCHLPMEARASDAGPGALRVAMSPEERRLATEKALEAVPGAVGVNNHMGSALAADVDGMRQVLGILQQRGLFFIDSRTSSDTVGYTVARELGLRAAERQVFLDNERDKAAIRQQLAELSRQAQSRGGAIGIAHPYPETLAVLGEELPKLVEQGFRLVRASELLTP